MAASLRNQMKRLFCQSKRLTSSNPSAGVSLFKRECSVQAQEDSNLPSVDTIPQVVDPLQHQDYFDVRKLVDLETLFKNRVHFGHHKGSREAHMVPYIFGSRFEYDMINLDKTLPLFQDALNFVAHVAYRNGIILFISRNKIIMPNVEQVARDVKEFAHCRFWRDGLFTDSSNMFKNVTRLPDLCIFLNTLDNVFEPHPAILECSKLLIPTVGIVDTNCDPRLISYPIPGNDDTIQTQLYYLNLFKKAILIGKKKQVEDGIEVDDRDIMELLEQTNIEEEIVVDEGLEMDSLDAEELDEELQTGDVVNDQTGSNSASTDEENVDNSRL